LTGNVDLPTFVAYTGKPKTESKSRHKTIAMTKVEFSPLEKETTSFDFAFPQHHSRKVVKKLCLYGRMRNCIFLLVLITFCNTVSAQKKEIVLNFDETGRLVSQPMPRFMFFGCPKDCKSIYNVRARVLLPLDYFTDEKDKIDSVAEVTSGALKNKQSMLWKILACGKAGELDRLNKIVHSDADIVNWNLDGQKDKDQIIPEKLVEYVKFMRLLDSVKKYAADTAVRKIFFAELNSKYREFSPFRFGINGIPIEDKCMRFVPVLSKDDSCHCTQPGKKYIAVEFAIPEGLITEEMDADAFEVMQKFVMKKYAITRYNEILALYKDKLKDLKALQKNVKTNSGDVDALIAEIEKQSQLKKVCVDENKQAKLAEAEEKIVELKEKLEKKTGRLNCDNSGCDTENILFCTPELSGWLLRLVWLNGDMIRLNPFNVTNKSVATAETKFVAEDQEEISEADMAMFLKNDIDMISFWNTAISHFQDSVLRDKKITIDSAKAGIADLIAARTKVQKHLDELTKANKNAEKGKATNTAATKKNGDQMTSLLTVSKVKYRGWVVPYKMGQDRMWLRNYNYEKDGLISKDKFKFTYPENEHLTVLVHNLMPGMAVKISETIVPASDTSEFNVFAYDAVKQLSQLYASVQPIAGMVVAGLQHINSIPPPNTTEEALAKSFVEILPSKGGLASQPLRYTSLRDSTKLIKSMGLFATKPDVVTVRTKTDTVKIVMSDAKKTQQYVREVTKVIFNLVDTTRKNTFDTLVVDTESCYNEYLKSLVAFKSAPDLIDEPLEEREDTVASYFTYKYKLTDSIPAYINKYSISVAGSDNAEALKNALRTSSFIKVAPYHYFSLAAGIAYTPGGGSLTSIDTSGGGFKINRDEDKMRLIVGIRWYPAGLYNLKNPASLFRDGRWLHRLSVLAGTGFPKPLENLYLGAGFDVFPGLTFSTGGHFQQQNAYEVVNNQVSNRSIRYSTRLFYSVTMDPTLFIAAITSIFKK
jgi:hypothetical protein